MSRVGAFVLLACLTLATWLGLTSSNASAETDEYAVKAAFLYNFTKYVKWPGRAFGKPDAPIVIAIVGADPFGKKLDETLKDKLVGTHPLTVVRWATVEQLADCHLLFVPSSQAGRLAEIVAFYAKRNTLLVGESEGFAKRRGCINFYIESKKVRLEVNAEAAKRAELEISSQLLKLARLVKEEEEAEPAR